MTRSRQERKIMLYNIGMGQRWVAATTMGLKSEQGNRYLSKGGTGMNGSRGLRPPEIQNRYWDRKKAREGA